MNAEHKLITKKLHDITELLASADYESLSNMCHGVRLNAKEIENAIEEYGETLIPVPWSELTSAIIIEITNSIPKAWSVTCPLWSKAEGKSDLTLELTMIATPSGELTVELDNIHVL
ncbi:MAG: DUF7668 domain-containing protein [Pseudomonas asiatica]|uniref:DUF7668 domain-containing protein n=1 Tax=Pseudomonas TaxID=286 RepID=UPI00117A5E9E|nr:MULTISPECIES: hypothetical protein [Pseudomonas]QOE09748.1 hypothetical protein IE322_06705 [Pseudomonas asiatica]